MSASYYDKYTEDPAILKVGLRNIGFRENGYESCFEKLLPCRSCDSIVRRKKINNYVHQRLKVLHNSDYILSISL